MHDFKELFEKNAYSGWNINLYVLITYFHILQHTHFSYTSCSLTPSFKYVTMAGATNWITSLSGAVDLQHKGRTQVVAEDDRLLGHRVLAAGS
jgi:hypothetical protein